MSAAPVEVLVHVREGCHLCEEALRTLAALAEREPMLVRAVDIEADDALHRRYLERIPVVVVAGRELGDFVVDEARVLAAVRAARAAGAAPPGPSPPVA